MTSGPGRMATSAWTACLRTVSSASFSREANSGCGGFGRRADFAQRSGGVRPHHGGFVLEQLGQRRDGFGGLPALQSQFVDCLEPGSLVGRLQLAGQFLDRRIHGQSDWAGQDQPGAQGRKTRRFFVSMRSFLCSGFFNCSLEVNKFEVEGEKGKYVECGKFPRNAGFVHELLTQVSFGHGIDQAFQERLRCGPVLRRDIPDLRLQAGKHGFDGLAGFHLIGIVEPAVIGLLGQ